MSKNRESSVLLKTKASSFVIPWFKQEAEENQ